MVEKTVVEICVTLVIEQVQHRWMTSEQITESIRSVYGTIEALNRSAGELSPSTGPGTEVPDTLAALRRKPKQSLQKDHIICLECGKKLLLLSHRHVALHGLNPREYKRKWSIALTTALSARTLTARRRKLAKQMGVGKKLADWRATHNHVTG